MTMTVDEFIRTKVLPEYRDVVNAFRALMKTYAPEAAEIISYGIPAYRLRRNIIYISPTKKGITFAFSEGASFDDPYGLLEGVGRKSKNVRVRRVADIDERAMAFYIRQAVEKDDRG